MDLQDYERLNPRYALRHAGKEITYITPNTFTLRRVETLFDKEPCTIEWIASFQPGETLIDVGANVGMYTIWAAMTREVRVYAFEPESQNYALLNRNIQANQLGSRVKAFCLALSDHSGLSELHLSNFTLGGSCHSLDDPVNHMHAPMRPAYTQGCVAECLDQLIAAGSVPAPEHIKIDVDGFEPKVVRGAQQTIRSTKTRSLLIEVNQNLPDHMRMVEEILGWGFHYDAAQVERVVRPSGLFKGCAEYVFKR